MSSIKINTEAVKSKVIPPLTKSKTFLNSAINSISSAIIPEDFIYGNQYKGFASNLRSLEALANEINSWLNQVADAFETADRKNNNIVNQMASSIDKFNLSISYRNSAISKEKLNKFEKGSSEIKRLKNNRDNIEIGRIKYDWTKEIKKTAASAGNTVISFAKGIGQFGESLVDFALIAEKVFHLPENLVGYGVSSLLSNLIGKDTAEDNNKKETNKSFIDSLVAIGNDFIESTFGETMAFVAEDHVGNAFSSFYDTGVGEWLDDNAIGIFKSDGIACEITSGIGYVSGIIVLSVATAGVGGAAVGAGGAAGGAAAGATATAGATTMTMVSSGIATVSGIGNYTEEYWAGLRDSSWEGIERMYENGELEEDAFNSIQMIRSLSDENWQEIVNDYNNGNIDEESFEVIKQIREMPDDWITMENAVKGLGYGTANGIWEGIQWYVGGKLGNWVIKGGSQIATSAVRVGADTAMNALDTPYRTAVESVISGKSFGEVWTKQGGWTSMLVNVGVGLLGSVGGEIGDITKAAKSGQADLEKVGLNEMLQSKIDEFDKLTKLTDNDDFRKYMDAVNNLETQDLNSIYAQVHTKMSLLQNEIAEMQQKIGISVGEQPNINYEKVSKADLTSQTLKAKINQLNSLEELTNTKQYKEYLDDFKKGNTIELDSIPYQIDQQIQKLKQEIASIQEKTVEFQGQQQSSSVTSKISSVFDSVQEKAKLMLDERGANIEKTIQDTNTKLTDVTAVKTVAGIALSPIGSLNKMFKKDLAENIQLKNTALSEGVVHFTSEEAANAILDSGYVKKSNSFISYGTPSSFFFAGTPSIGDVALNLDYLSNKLIGVKIKPTEEVLDSFKYRYMDDQALLWKGDFNFKDLGLEAEKAYYVLQKIDGKLNYVEVAKEVFDNFNENNLPVKGKLLSTLYSGAVGMSYQADLLLNNLKNTKAQIGSMTSKVSTFFDSIIINPKTKKQKLQSIIENSDFNKENLIDGIINEIPKNLDMLSKLRLIYLKLNQSVSYSDSYFAMNKAKEIYVEELYEIYTKKFDISDMQTNSIICSNWSQIYAELLKEVGVNPSKIKIVGGDVIGNHKYVTVDLGKGKLLVADGTSNFTGYTDLVNSKYGRATGGFIVTTKEKFESMLKESENILKENGKYSEGAKYNRTVKQLSIYQDRKKINIIDEEIGYSNNRYLKDFNDIVSIYQRQTKNSIAMEDKINAFARLLDDKNLGAIDAFPMMKNYAQNFLGNDTQVTLHYTEDNVIDVVRITLDDGNIAYLYKKNNSNLEFTYHINSVLGEY